MGDRGRVDEVKVTSRRVFGWRMRRDAEPEVLV
jgi:hypothetical protein